jgi:hypothetical protein
MGWRIERMKLNSKCPERFNRALLDEPQGKSIPGRWRHKKMDGSWWCTPIIQLLGRQR